MRRRRRCLGGQRFQEGKQVAHIIERHALIGGVGKCRVEVLAVAPHAAQHGVDEGGFAPGADAVPRSDEMLGTLNVPKGVSRARPPPSRCLSSCFGVAWQDAHPPTLKRVSPLARLGVWAGSAPRGDDLGDGQDIEGDGSGERHDAESGNEGPDAHAFILSS